MRMVMDLCFLEVLEFTLLPIEMALVRCARSQEGVLRGAMATVGLELLDYGSFTAVALNLPDVTAYRVTAYSKAWREKAERATASRFG